MTATTIHPKPLTLWQQQLRAAYDSLMRSLRVPKNTSIATPQDEAIPLLA